MRLTISAFTLAAICGTTAMAQPVARHLIDDADVVETLYSEQALINSNRTASIHLLEDLNADGVTEVLLSSRFAPHNGLEDTMASRVRDPRSGATLVEFVRAPLLATGLGHYDAVMIDDINADGVRDIAVSRQLSTGALLRVYSGATGEVLRSPFEENFRFPFGLSLLPWEDIDGDGHPDLIASNIGNNQSLAAFITWSPGSGAAEIFSLADYPPNGGINEVGRAMLDLGEGTTGSREFLATLSQGFQSMVQAFGGDPLGFEASYISSTSSSLDGLVDGGAVRLGDLNGDGHREIVVTGRLPHPDIPGVLGLPVISGAIPTDFSQQLDLFTAHTPRVTLQVDGEFMTLEPPANHSVEPLGDATGDGFPDYALVGSMTHGFFPDEFDTQHIVAVCGRTGRAFFAAQMEIEQGDNVVASMILLLTTPSRARDAVVSPGDLNNDGAPDLLVLVYRDDFGDGSEDPIREQLLLTHYLPTPCAGDVDFDRVVNFADLNAVLSNFGAQDITLPADLNASGVVDLADLNLVLSAFGVSCD